MSLFKKNLTAHIAIGALSLLLSIIFVKNFPALPVISDSEDYHTIATHILSDKTYVTISSDEILYPPLYPLFLAFIYSLGLGTFATVYLIQYFLVGGIAICVFWLLRKYTRATLTIALLASTLILFWPYFILYSQLISSEILYSFLLILSLIFLLKINSNSKPNLVVGAGITLGLTILTRPVALLLLPWILVALIFVKKLPGIFGQLSIPWKKYLLIGIVMILTIMPWELYVQKKYDRIIPVASNLSYVFKKANGTMAYLSPDSAAQEVSILKAKAKNIYLFWNPGATGYHLDILQEKYPVAGPLVLLYKIIFFLILGLAFIGACAHRKYPLVLFSVITILYFWALHTVLFPFPRYTLPIIPFVIIVAAIGATLTHDQFRKTN